MEVAWVDVQVVPGGSLLSGPLGRAGRDSVNRRRLTQPLSQ